MTDKSAFTADEWHAVTDAPLLVTMAIFAAGEHGPISMVKEASASARSIANPGDRGVATELIAQIAAEADSKEARHDMNQHRGKDLDTAIAGALADLEPAAAALRKNLSTMEAAEVGGLARRHRASGGRGGEDGEPERAGDDREDHRDLPGDGELIERSAYCAAKKSRMRSDALIVRGRRPEHREVDEAVGPGVATTLDRVERRREAGVAADERALLDVGLDARLDRGGVAPVARRPGRGERPHDAVGDDRGRRCRGRRASGSSSRSRRRERARSRPRTRRTRSGSRTPPPPRTHHRSTSPW